MEYLAGGVNLHGALKLARTEIFNVNRGDRAPVQNVIVLVTSGEPTHYTEDDGSIDTLNWAKARSMALDEANHLKNLGVRIFGVGAGIDVSV